MYLRYIYLTADYCWYFFQMEAGNVSNFCITEGYRRVPKECELLNLPFFIDGWNFSDYC